MHQNRKKVPVFQFCADSRKNFPAFRSSGFGTELASRHNKSLFGQSNLSICVQISPTGRGEWMWYSVFFNKKINFIHRNWNKIVFRLLPMWWTLLKWQKSKYLFSLDLIVKLTLINLSHSFFFTSEWKMSAMVLEMRYCQNALSETSLFGEIFSFCPKT